MAYSYKGSISFGLVYIPVTLHSAVRDNSISFNMIDKCTAREYAMRMIKHVLKETGITATAGIGTNMYLCKVAMDIVAKHVPADKDGVRIAELDEMTYRKTLWSHRPLTDFWRIGNGYSDKLEQCGLFTMGDIRRYGARRHYALFPFARSARGQSGMEKALRSARHEGVFGRHGQFIRRIGGERPLAAGDLFRLALRFGAAGRKL